MKTTLGSSVSVAPNLPVTEKRRLATLADEILAADAQRHGKRQARQIRRRISRGRYR